MIPAEYRRLVVAMTAAWIAIVTLVFFVSRSYPHPPEQLTARHLTNSSFDPPPPAPPAMTVVQSVWRDFWRPDDYRLRSSTLPTQAGVFWIAIIVAVVVAFDFNRLTSSRNLELIALMAIGFLMFNIMRFFALLGDPVYFTVMDWVFTGIVLVSLGLFALAVWRVRRPHQTSWRPNLGVRPLIALTVVVLSANVSIALFAQPDDAGFYTNLGAQRLRERLRFPYGDPLLTNSAGAGYGPVLYLAHLPYQLMLHPSPVNTTQPTRADLGQGATYVLPPPLATQLTTITFHLIGVTALIIIGLQLAGPAVAWGLAALYCGSAYVMGVGGAAEAIGGMTFISHISPAAMSLLAFAALSRPLAAGALLVLAAGTVFYPVLFFPAWLGYYWKAPDDAKSASWAPRRPHPDAVRFVAGCVLAAIVLGVPVLMRSQALPGRSVVSTVLQESVGHHQGTSTYGLSTFGFWGQRSGIRAWLRDPIGGSEFTASPMFILTIGGAAVLFFLALGCTPTQLALLTGALGILAQWSKIHGTGVYVNWYYAFFLIGVFASGTTREDGADLPHSKS